MSGAADVGVVGAGIVGLSTAHALLERGASVAVYESGAPGSGDFGEVGTYAAPLPGNRRYAVGFSRRSASRRTGASSISRASPRGRDDLRPESPQEVPQSADTPT